jgi:multicomponent Na+:H+ antiporter subunit G
MIMDIVVAVLLVSGGAFCFVAGLGLLRLQDVYLRMHAATKAGTLGAGLILVGVAVHFGELGIDIRALLAIAFLVITAPVAAHMIGRTAYRSRVAMWEGSTVDEWEGRVPRAGDPAPTQHERSTK